MHPSDPTNHSSEPSDATPTRRRLLGTMAAAGALLGLNAANASAATPQAKEAAPSPVVPDALFAMARLRDYKCKR